MLHSRERAPEAWARYKAGIAAGVTFKPYMVRNWYGFRAQHLTRWAPELGELGPDRPDVLGRIG